MSNMRRASKLRLATDLQMQQIAAMVETGKGPAKLLFPVVSDLAGDNKHPGTTTSLSSSSSTSSSLGPGPGGGGVGGGSEVRPADTLRTTTRPLNATYRARGGEQSDDWTRRFKDAWWYPLWRCYRPCHRVVTRMAESTTFEAFIMATTFVNCIFLATDDPRREALSYQATAYNIFTGIFGIEFLLKVMAQGPVKYFSEPWNLLDVAVLIQGILDIFIKSTLGALKALRVLRALGSFKRIPQLRRIVSTLLKSLPSMRDITTVTIFVIFLLSIFGSMLWQGLFKYQCVDPVTGELYQTDTGIAQVCGYKFAVNDTSLAAGGGGGASCKDMLDLARPLQCPDGYVCMNTGHSPHHGLTSFDNVAVSMMNWFQIITMQGWSEALFYTQMSMGRETIMIFVVVILLGAGVLVNLLIAAMMARLGSVLTNQGGGGSNGNDGGDGDGNNKKEEGDDGSSGSSLSDDSSDDDEDDEDEDACDGGGRRDNDAAGGEGPPLDSTTCTAMTAAYERDGQQQEGGGRGGGGLTKVKARKPSSSRRKGWWHCLMKGIAWKPLRHQVHNDASVFSFLSFLAIVVSVLTMTIDAWGNPPTLTNSLNDVTYVISWVFCVEGAIKVLGLGLYGYFFNVSNLCDFAIIMGFALEAALSGSSSIGALRILRFMRLIRLLRMARLAKKYPAFVRVIAVLGSSFVTSWPIIVLLLLFTFIYAILAMDLFGGELPVDDYMRFDTFFWSFTNTFMILSGENWNTMYFAASMVAPVATPVFFITWILMGQYILLNLVMAVILEECGSVMGGQETKSHHMERMSNAFRRHALTLSFCHWKGLYRSATLTTADLQAIAAFNDNDTRYAIKSADPFLFIGLYYSHTNHAALLLHKVTHRRLKATGERFVPVVRRYKALVTDQHTKGDDDEQQHQLATTTTTRRRARYQVRRQSSFLPSSPIRAEVKMLVTHPAFNDFVLLIIAINSYVMCWANPTGSNPLWLLYLQIISVGIFILEVVLKIIAYHAFTGPKAFFKDKVNCFDFFLVVVMVLGILAELLHSYTASSIFAAILSLRPVRLLLRIPAIKEMLVALASSIASLGTLSGVLVFCMYGYALVGCQLYKGSFYKCSDPSFPPGAMLFGPDALPCNGTIDNSFYNFDNVAEGMVSVFIMCTVDGWSAILFDCLNAVGPGQQPQYNTNAFAFAYLLVGVSFFGFFMMQMFVGVVFDNFQRIRAVRYDGSTVSEELKSWDEQYHRIRMLTPLVRKDPPSHPVSRFFFIIVRSEIFEKVLLTVIALNAGFLCLQGIQVNSTIELASSVFDKFVVAFFVMEAALKLVALGPSKYLRSPSNRFDLLITAVGVVDMVVSAVFGCGNSKILIFTILRSLRVLRLVRILNAFTSLRVIVRAIIFPMGKLVMVGIIMLVVIYVYANIGITVFPHVQLPTPIQTFANFQSVQDAMSLFFIFCTGELYNDALQWLGNYPTTNLPSPAAKALFKPLAIAFLVSFQIAVKILLFNLFVLVIVEAYTIMLGDTGGLPEYHTINFREQWRHFDPGATGRIPRLRLYNLMSCLPYPLGFAKGLSFRDKCVRVAEMDLQGSFVTFHDVLQRIQDFIFEMVHNRQALEDRLHIVHSVVVIQRFGRLVLGKARAWRAAYGDDDDDYDDEEGRRSSRRSTRVSSGSGGSKKRRSTGRKRTRQRGATTTITSFDDGADADDGYYYDGGGLGSPRGGGPLSLSPRSGGGWGDVTWTDNPLGGDRTTTSASDTTSRWSLSDKRRAQNGRRELLAAARWAEARQKARQEGREKGGRGQQGDEHPPPSPSSPWSGAAATGGGGGGWGFLQWPSSAPSQQQQQQQQAPPSSPIRGGGPPPSPGSPSQQPRARQAEGGGGGAGGGQRNAQQQQQQQRRDLV